MRNLMLLACLLALFFPTTVWAEGPEVVIDNGDPGFSTEGHWYAGDGGHSYSGDCVWAPRGIQDRKSVV
jgi:hypothetical protein